MISKLLRLSALLGAIWIVLGNPAQAADLNGSWATNPSVCNKVFIKKGDVISFAQDSDQYDGGLIIEGSRSGGRCRAAPSRRERRFQTSSI